jgi:hypothetical protein
MPTLADRGCRVVSATDPHSRKLGFLDPGMNSLHFHLFSVLTWRRLTIHSTVLTPVLPQASAV